MLILNRRLNEKILAGYALAKDDPEGTADVVMRVSMIDQKNGYPSVLADMLWYDGNDQQIREVVRFDALNPDFTVGDLKIQLLSIDTKENRVPVVRLGFNAPPALKIIRSEVEVIE